MNANENPDPTRKKWNRKRFDARYGALVEAGYTILVNDFRIKEDEIITTTLNVRKDDLPDIYNRDKTIGVAIGILQEETLLSYLMGTFETIVHLPFPYRELIKKSHLPTHYRVFKRNSLMVEWTSPVIWGDSLTKGVSRKE